MPGVMLAAIVLAEGVVAFCALAFELAAARMLAPFAGQSTDTWTAIIAAFLLSWAVGNHLGGRFAGTGGAAARLLRAAAACAAAGACIAAMPSIVGRLDAAILAPAPSELWRIVLFCALPCLPAGLLLGIATPLLMTAALDVGGRRGALVGIVTAAGAAGSLMGALSVLWLLLDGLGVRLTFQALGLLAGLNAAALGLAAGALRREAAGV